MIQPQLRVKLLVAAGVAGASLLGATFVGCQSSPTSQAQTGPYGQYNGSQFTGAGGQFAGPNGQQPPGYGAAPQMAAAGAPGSNFSPQSQQAFLNETQRLGTQQNLSAQDVVAMSRSGMSEQQIALAVQQRGSALRATPGMSQYLAQNGVNPAVLGLGQVGGLSQPGGSYPGAFGPQVAMNDPQSAYGNANAGRPAFNPAAASGVTPAAYPAGQSDPGQMQSAAYESSISSPALDGSAAAGGSTNGQTWRAMPH